MARCMALLRVGRGAITGCHMTWTTCTHTSRLSGQRPETGFDLRCSAQTLEAACLELWALLQEIHRT